MATFIVKFDTDNEAFQSDCDAEIARILRIIAVKVEQHGCGGSFETIHDINGNNVGRYSLKP